MRRANWAPRWPRDSPWASGEGPQFPEIKRGVKSVIALAGSSEASCCKLLSRRLRRRHPAHARRGHEAAQSAKGQRDTVAEAEAIQPAHSAVSAIRVSASASGSARFNRFGFDMVSSQVEMPGRMIGRPPVLGHPLVVRYRRAIPGRPAGDTDQTMHGSGARATLKPMRAARAAP